MDVIGTCPYEVVSGSGEIMILTDVLFAPEIVQNLINIHKLAECKHEVRFKSTDVYIIRDAGIAFSGFTDNNLDVLNEPVAANIFLSANI